MLFNYIYLRIKAYAFSNINNTEVYYNLNIKRTIINRLYFNTFNYTII